MKKQMSKPKPKQASEHLVTRGCFFLMLGMEERGGEGIPCPCRWLPSTLTGLGRAENICVHLVRAFQHGDLIN